MRRLISIENQRLLGMSIHLLLIITWFVIVALAYLTNNLSWIFKSVLVIMIISTVIEVINIGPDMRHRTLIYNLALLSICFFFLLNGLGQSMLFSNTIGLSAYPPNTPHITMIGLDMSGDLFAHVFELPEVGVVVGFGLFGMVLVNAGDAGNIDAAYIGGTIMVTVPAGGVLYAIFTGSIPPSEYFYSVGGSSATLLQFSAVLGVTIVLVMVTYMWDDFIGSVKGREEQ